MTANKYNIAVVGAGPAGSVAAHRLASNGARVIIFDPSHPREKTCGGGISAKARTLFPELEPLVAKGKTGTMLRLVSPAGRTTVVKGGGNTFAINRALLDGYLLDRAIEAGAVLQKKKVLDVQLEGNTWSIQTGETKYKADVLIGADGVLSVVRRKLALRIPKKHLALGAHYLVPGLNPPSALLQFFGDRRGYGWIFNRKDCSSIGVGMPLTNRKDWRRMLDRLLKHHAGERKPLGFSSWYLPQPSDESAFDFQTASDNWCMVGDAAGHADPFTGEGIVYAMWGGKLAAECILDGACARYDENWRDEYLARFGKSIKLSYLLEKRFVLEGLLALGRVPYVGSLIYNKINSSK